MKIKKFGHSCLLVEENNVRILLDPGSYSTLQNDVKDVDIILITHGHSDHCDLNSLKEILSNNPNAKIYTNKEVGKKLSENSIKFELLENGQATNFRDVTIEGIGEKHALIYTGVPVIQNVGYLIAGRLFCPGDAVTIHDKPVEILALIVNAPWLSTAQAIDYAKQIKPKACFPVHDGQLKIKKSYHKLPEDCLTPAGIKWVVIEESITVEF